MMNVIRNVCVSSVIPRFAGSLFIFPRLRSFYSKMPGKPDAKPPNVMILTDEEDKFARAKSVLHNILPPDRFLVYGLKLSDMLSDCPWMTNVNILIHLQHNHKQRQMEQKLKLFIEQKGQVKDYFSIPVYS